MTDYHPEPVALFPYFYANEAIAELSRHQAWSVSDNNGRPLDIVGLMATGRVYGASPDHFDTSLMTLPQLSHALPNAANCAYFASFARDEVLVFDIEKTCPPELALALLRLPHSYGEVSRSGKGFHIIVEAPDDPELRRRLRNTPTTALRAEGGVYEILVEHWVTFTRHPITQDHINWLTERAGDNYVDDIDLTSMLTSLLDDYDRPMLRFDSSDAVDAVGIDQARQAPLYAEILAQMCAHPFEADVDDYEGDHSRFEFAAMNWFYHQFVAAAGQLGRVNDYDDATRAVLIYDACTETLPHRDKHDTPRAGMPYLLYSASRCVATR